MKSRWEESEKRREEKSREEKRREEEKKKEDQKEKVSEESRETLCFFIDLWFRRVEN